MAGPYRIGELAEAAGVPTSTVRYYERRRLLPPPARTAANYRVYDAAALDRLRFIRAAQATGFTLEDVALLLDLRDGATEPCDEVQALIQERLADTEQRLADLHHVREVLASSLDLCRSTDAAETCEVLEQLTDASAEDHTAVRRTSPA